MQSGEKIERTYRYSDKSVRKILNTYVRFFDKTRRKKILSDDVLRSGFYNAFTWAAVRAGVTADAFFIVDDGQIIHEFYRAFGAGTLAFAARDTTFFASGYNLFSLAVIRAADVHFCRRGDPIDDTFRTSGNARAARPANLVINLRNVVFSDLDRAVRASLNARPQSETTVRTRLAAARNAGCERAVVRSYVREFVRAVRSADTMHDGNGGI